MQNKKSNIIRTTLILKVYILLLLAPAYTQEMVRPDTTAYDSQRNKVNEMLQDRSRRFGQFDESLKKRTGIFGLKTKRDMQASINILKEIVLADNEIFRETKLLLDFKDFEKEEIAKQAEEFDQRINGYINTISKLQIEQTELRNELEKLQDTKRSASGRLIFTCIIITLLISGGYWYYFRRKKKQA